jgi:WD40 repeat protein
VGFHPQTGSLFATGRAGFSLWPIVTEGEGQARVVTIGPRQNSGGLSGLQRSSLSPDGKTLLVAGPDALLALEIGRSGTIEHQLLQGPHPGVASASISPDGKWGATGTWKGTGVKIWDLNARKLLRDLPVAESAFVQFSPDGRWLITATGAEYRTWNVATWEPVKVISRDRTGDVPGPICYSPDGKLLALRLNLNMGFALFDAATYDRLADFDAGPQIPLGFRPDGEELIVQGDEGLLQAWNLRALRARLCEMNLDLGIPAFAPPSEIRSTSNVVLKSN